MLDVLPLSALALLLAGCGDNMRYQPRADTYDPAPFFEDGASARRPPVGTVARGYLREDTAFYEGRAADGTFVRELPMELDEALLLRGQREFDIYCAVCHGRDGYGDGMIVRRGFPPPPSFHEERLREAPLGYFVHVITHGYGVMYPYNTRVAPEDRWAISAYIRTLQLSQYAPAEAMAEGGTP